MVLAKTAVHPRKQKSLTTCHTMRTAWQDGENGPGSDRTSGSSPMTTPVLVLNASYEPINICGARRALVLVLKGVARTEEQHGEEMLHAARMDVAMPSVIRLLEYRRIPHQTRALSRKNILLRDRNSCQYCGVILTSAELTLDHVIPRSRGGLSTWENLVACCHNCNRRKGNLMLHELREMKLIREPRPFTLHTSRHIMRAIGGNDEQWRKYLYF
jgi:5-methylcytosine-specific restriction endonuclease McrA